MGMDSSVARATTADEEVGTCEDSDGALGMPSGQTGSGGGSFDKRSVLAGATSAESSTEAGVPTDISVFRRCEAGTSSPVPIKVANGDLCVALRCVAGPGADDVGAGVMDRGTGVIERDADETERGAGVTERGAGVTERGAGVTERDADETERGAGVAKGNPLREDAGALMLTGATGKLTLGKVELREGTGRGWATEPEERKLGPKNPVISA